MGVEEPTRWDSWPLVRLLTVLSIFAAVAHFRFGWAISFADLASLPRRTFEVLSFFTLISFGLAHLYLMLLAFPVYAIVTLNDTFYEASCSIVRALFRIDGAPAQWLGLGGEIALFWLLGFALRTLLN